MKNLIYLILLSITIISCGGNEGDLIKIPKTKEVTLGIKYDVKSDSGSFKSSGSSCTFPNPYVHPIPSEFNVYFIPKDGGSTIEFNSVSTGNNTFKITPKDYTVVVTNSDKTLFEDLPNYSSELYLFSSKDIDFITESNASITVNNNYSAIMVVKNNLITAIPTVEGVPMVDVGDYYNLYSKLSGPLLVDINNGQEQVSRRFPSNYVVRFMVCPEVNLGIILNDIFIYPEVDIEL